MLRKSVTIIIALMFLLLTIGCGPSLQQVQGELAYYEYLKTQTPTPLVRLKIADPTKPVNLESLEVYLPNQGQAQQYQHKDYAAPWIGVANNVLSVGLPWLGVGYLVHEMRDMGQTNTQYNNIGNGSIKTQGNSYNVNSGTASAGMGNIDGTTPQQVVKPEVVNPVAVEQQVVNPVVVTP